MIRHTRPGPRGMGNYNPFDINVVAANTQAALDRWSAGKQQEYDLNYQSAMQRWEYGGRVGPQPVRQIAPTGAEEMARNEREFYQELRDLGISDQQQAATNAYNSQQFSTAWTASLPPPAPLTVTITPDGKGGYTYPAYTPVPAAPALVSAPTPVPAAPAPAPTAPQVLSQPVAAPVPAPVAATAPEAPPPAGTNTYQAPPVAVTVTLPTSSGGGTPASAPTAPPRQTAAPLTTISVPGGGQVSIPSPAAVAGQLPQWLREVPWYVWAGSAAAGLYLLNKRGRR